jgi:hypothetical protein
MTHDEVRLLAAGAALGDLEPGEQLAATAHAATCPDCASLPADLLHVLADLALLAPPRVPPAALLGRVRTAIREAEAISAAAASPRAEATVHEAPPRPITSIEAFRARRRPLAAALAMAAAFAIAAAGLGVASARLSSELDQTRARVASLEAQASGSEALMAALADPIHRTAALQAKASAPGASAVVVYVPGTKEAWIVADHLPATPAGSAYELWYADAAGVHPLTTATWDGKGVMVAPVGVDLANSAAVMVTLERSGGSTGTPGPEVVFGEL